MTDDNIQSNISALISVENITNNLLIFPHKSIYYVSFALFEETENKMYLLNVGDTYVDAGDRIRMNYDLKSLFLDADTISLATISSCLKLEDDSKVKLNKAVIDYILDRNDAYSSKDSIKLNDFDVHTLNEILCNNEKFEPRINKIIIMVPNFIEKIYPLMKDFIKK